MADLMTGVASTALLVNHSRLLRPELSRDVFAGEWIPEERRGEVADLWDEYAASVYPHDDVVTSVRGRMALELVEACVRRDPETTLVVVGAGFTSYPWLLPVKRSIELDQPSVVEAKRSRAEVLMRRGILPCRQVRYEGVDLESEETIVRLNGLIEQVVPEGGTVTLVIEGVLYYLSDQASLRLLQGCRSLARPTLGQMLSYWPEGVQSHPVLSRQAAWFRSRLVPEETSYLDAGLLRSVLGDAVELLGPEELQQRFSVSPVLSSDFLVPEWVAVNHP